DVYDEVLEPHQQGRLHVLFGKDVDLKRDGYNLNQSKIAPGSGGWIGRGFLEGTQTQGGFGPGQHTEHRLTTVRDARAVLCWFVGSHRFVCNTFVENLVFV